MIAPPDVARQFSMSAFFAVGGMRRYLTDHPSTPIDEVIQALRRSDADYAAADFSGGLGLHDLLPAEIDFAEPRIAIREGLTVLIQRYLPWWCRLFPYGRQRLATALTQDEVQTFRSAGLFEDPPSLAVVEWWDAFAASMRSLEDERRNAQGRHAEMLSLEYERKRLTGLSIDQEPKWTSVEDNAAGYDIQSFDLTDFGLKNRLIEVKSSQRKPPQLFLSRGEWEAAMKYGASYFFYIWELPSEVLTIKTVEEMAVHIPDDSGDGVWTEVVIEL